MKRAAAALVTAGLVSACAASQGRADGSPMDCTPPFSYDARSLEAGVSVGRFGADFETSVDAVRQVDTMAERYAGRWTTLCREYNAGAVDGEEYRRRSQALTQTMGRLDELFMTLSHAPDATAYQHALREAYSLARPDAVDLAVDLTVTAQTPGESQFQVLPLGSAIPTGTKVRLSAGVSSAAFVYVYQVAADDSINVLFPAEQFGGNPIAAGHELAIPPAPAFFRLDDNDVGREEIHVVASATPIDSLEAALDRTSTDATATTVAQLDCHARGLTYESGTECPRSRGLVLENGGGRSSLSGVNTAADDAVHLVYHFEHTAG